jgi:transposase
MYRGIAATATSLSTSEAAIGRILTKWTETRAKGHLDDQLPDMLALKTIRVNGRDRVLIADADSLEVVDLLAERDEFETWCNGRGIPTTVLMDVDPDLRRRIARLFPSATIVVAPAMSAVIIEMAVLRELMSIQKKSKAEGRNQRISPGLMRKRSSELDHDDRMEMEWWPEQARRLWRAKESLLDAITLPSGFERDLLVASARTDMHDCSKSTLPALLDAWLDAILAGADRPWTNEVNERINHLLKTAKRCKPKAGHAILRAIIVFEGDDAGAIYALSVPLPRGQGTPPTKSSRSLEDATDALYAMAEK